MKIGTQLGVALAAPILLWSGVVFGQAATPPASQGKAPQTPQTIEGQVTRIDRAQGRVRIQAADGTMHEFQASPETLQDLKEGDRIQARLRQR
jgi:hypothetical protein